ncbi:hypothetical protein Tco_1468655 [Tanacetum coccineum]
MSPSMEARIAEYAAAPTPPSPPPSPLSPWSPPLPQIPSPPLPPLPSSLHLPPHVPTSLPLPLPPRKRLCPTAPTSRYEVGRVRLLLLDLVEVIEQIMGLLALWVPRSDVREPRRSAMTLGEQDTQDIYAVIEDGQDRQTRLFQRVDRLVKDRQFHYETARLLDREAHVS